MSTKIAIGISLIGAVILGALISGIGTAETDKKITTETAFSTAQEQDIKGLIHDFLMENPEVLIASLNEYQSREQRAAEDRMINGGRKYFSKLVDGDGGFSIETSAEQTKVVVVEFFDYHCAYCKNATGLVQKLVDGDPEVKVVLRELPILRPESHLAASYALASRDQGKYAEFHFTLMNASGVLSESRIKSLAKKVGLDVPKLEKAIKNPKIAKALKESDSIAEEMGVGGTPAFLIATVDGKFLDVLPGFSEANVNAAIKEAKRIASAPKK